MSVPDERFNLAWYRTEVTRLEDKLDAYRGLGDFDRLRELAEADRAGLLQVIDKGLFCRNASKRDGKCAGYHENMFSRISGLVQSPVRVDEVPPASMQ